jgi:RNA polymerase sigma factor for flagellar operon FliA
VQERALRLVEGNVDLARALASRYLSRIPRSVDHDAIVGAAHEGLCLAAISFDPTRGVPFRRWAARRIIGRMRDEMREQDHLSRRTRRRLDPADPLYDPDFIRVSPDRPSSLDESLRRILGDGIDEDITVMDTILDPHAPDPSENGHGTKDRVFGMMAGLPDREFRVVTLRYFGGMRRTEVARSMEISESRVGQIETMALERMRRGEE